MRDDRGGGGELSVFFVLCSFFFSLAGFFPGGESSRDVNLITQLHLMPRLGMNRAVPLLHLYAFMAWTGQTLPLLVYLLT
jgi:hypothetical protein